MRFWLCLFLLQSVFASVNLAWAESYRREVNFEWEEIADAKGYDIEIRGLTKDGPGKPQVYKTKEALWIGKLTPGKYTMSLRSRDIRGVPGEWSPPSEFDVSLDPVKITLPAQNAEIKGDDEKEISQKFEWSPVGGADEYHFELSSDDGKTQIIETVNKTTYTSKIPVARNYQVKITASGLNGMKSESTTVAQFAVIGKKLALPKITPPDTEFVRELRWKKSEYSENYDLTLNRLNPTTKKWEKVLAQENITGDSFEFDPSHPGGTYSLHVQAKGKLRLNSDPAKINFKVVNGNRSPAAEYTALVRKSIDRVSGWYGIASYLITQITYRGETPETGGLTTTVALGGTGRLGGGFFTKDNKWGFLGIVDMSGFTISDKTRTYSSIELSGISRYVSGDRGETRLIAGLYYKELPQMIGTPSAAPGSNSNVSFVQSAVGGPHLGVEYWHSISPKLGFQTNAHGYYSLLTVKSPNGNNVEPRLSYQIGLMGSYRVTHQFTGLMGITHRIDQLAYRANKTGLSTQGTGDFDETRITGNYLSFYAEYGF